MAAEIVRSQRLDNVAVITMDDGKANALSHEMIGSLHECLDDAASEAAAVLLTGRERRLSGGFDLREMTSSAEAARKLVTAGAELLLRLYTFPRPVVVACTGHALAAGAILLLVADMRIGASGDFKIGLNEVAIQMTLPIFAMELARARLSKRHFTEATTQAHIFDPHAAVDAGFLDAAVEPHALFDVALDHARRLATLPDPAFHNTKERERATTVRLIRDTLEADMATLTSPSPS
jgi:enoyl-CoA hydratase